MNGSNPGVVRKNVASSCQRRQEGGDGYGRLCELRTVPSGGQLYAMCGTVVVFALPILSSLFSSQLKSVRTRSTRVEMAARRGHINGRDDASSAATRVYFPAWRYLFFLCPSFHLHIGQRPYDTNMPSTSMHRSESRRTRVLGRTFSERTGSSCFPVPFSKCTGFMA